MHARRKCQRSVSSAFCSKGRAGVCVFLSLLDVVFLFGRLIFLVGFVVQFLLKLIRFPLHFLGGVALGFFSGGNIVFRAVDDYNNQKCMCFKK